MLLLLTVRLTDVNAQSSDMTFTAIGIFDQISSCRMDRFFSKGYINIHACFYSIPILGKLTSECAHAN